jgi:acyl-CoA dehydrogenase
MVCTPAGSERYFERMAAEQAGVEPLSWALQEVVRVLRTPRYMHTFVYEHPEFGFEDVLVPEAAVLGEVGAGYELTRDWFVEERLMIAARSVGAAERALRTAVDWARGREQFGRPIIE